MSLRAKTRLLGLDLSYEEIVHWDFPFADTSFKPAIEAAMKDPSYILEMPVHDGSREMLRELRRRSTVTILTVRPADVMGLTEEWLSSNGLVFDTRAGWGHVTRLAWAPQ